MGIYVTMCAVPRGSTAVSLEKQGLGRVSRRLTGSLGQVPAPWHPHEPALLKLTAPTGEMEVTGGSRGPGHRSRCDHSPSPH